MRYHEPSLINYLNFRQVVEWVERRVSIELFLSLIILKENRTISNAPRYKSFSLSSNVSKPVPCGRIPYLMRNSKRVSSFTIFSFHEFSPKALILSKILPQLLWEDSDEIPNSLIPKDTFAKEGSIIISRSQIYFLLQFLEPQKNLFESLLIL